MQFRLIEKQIGSIEKNALPLKTKQGAQICTPPFCDRMSKGNQNPSLKEGGGKDRRNCANSARNLRISSSTPTKIYP